MKKLLIIIAILATTYTTVDASTFTILKGTFLPKFGQVCIGTTTCTRAIAAPAGLSYYDTVIASGPRVYVRLGESSGTTATDEMAVLNGTYQSSYTLGQTGAISGDSNTAVDFGQYSSGAGEVAFTADASMDSRSVLTLEAWVKTHTGFGTAGTVRQILALGSPFGDEGGFILGMEESGVVNFRVSQGGNNNKNSGNSSTNINDGNYHHIVGRYDGSNVSIWVDGVKENQTAMTGSTDASPRNIGVGFAAVSGLWGFPGWIDEAAFYQVALTDADILEHYQTGIGI